MQKGVAGNAAFTSGRQMASNIDMLLRSIRDPFARAAVLYFLSILFIFIQLS